MLHLVRALLDRNQVYLKSISNLDLITKTIQVRQVQKEMMNMSRILKMIKNMEIKEKRKIPTNLTQDHIQEGKSCKRNSKLKEAKHKNRVLICNHNKRSHRLIDQNKVTK